MQRGRFAKPSVQTVQLMSEAVLRLGGWAALCEPASVVRAAVFIDEQLIPASLEWDEFDPASLHAVVFLNGVPVATGRLLPDARIGRMAVLAQWRGHGFGSRVLEALMKYAAQRGEREVRLDAQCHAEGFYRRHGFLAESEPFDDAGIAHRRMVKHLI
jgi:predicted GNAT family N-acyltransferase